MKIYTKTGDKGTTSLIGGKRVAKNHIRINAYGTVDELIAHIGVTRDHISFADMQNELLRIQDDLMICASILAADCGNCENQLPQLSDERIVWLEKRIDEMEKHLQPLSHFILPGGHASVSYAHVARTVCRRAERAIISLMDIEEVSEVIIQYFNRLSDYLFVFARYLGKQQEIEEIPWKPTLV